MMEDNPQRFAINVLLFSTLFPHAGEPTLGVFVENRLRHLIKDTNVNATVVAPVPWFPFKGKIFGSYGRQALADKIHHKNGLVIYHPRYLVIPKIGMMLTPYLLAWSAQRCIKKLIKAGLKIDLIDAHYLYPDGVAAARIAKAINKPFFLTARGSDVTQIALMKKPRDFILSSIKAAAHVITVSQSLKDKLVSIGASEEKITALRNGVDVSKFYPVEKARHRVIAETGLDSKKPIVVFAGWLIQRKRVDIVIDMLSHLPNMQAIIIGTGPLQFSLMQQAKKLDVANRVIFCGQKPPTEMPKYFTAANALILPSEREGWANVLLEAMACGTPVVSRAVDGACELVTNDIAGRLVEGDDPVAYATAVSDLLDKMPTSEQVRAYANKFSWLETSEGQFKLFSKVVSREDDT